jgi:hypothetical protein
MMRKTPLLKPVQKRYKHEKRIGNRFGCIEKAPAENAQKQSILGIANSGFLDLPDDGIPTQSFRTEDCQKDTQKSLLLRLMAKASTFVF